MSIRQVTLDAKGIDRIPAMWLIHVLGVRLQDYEQGQADSSYTATWSDGDKKRTLPAFLLRVGCRAVMWTRTGDDAFDEQSVEVIGASLDSAEQVEEYAKEWAEQRKADTPR